MADATTLAREQAADWMLRLESGSADAGDLRQLDTWLDDAPDHQAAYADIKGLWDDLAEVAIVAPAAAAAAVPTSAPPVRFWARPFARSLAAIAAVLLLAFVGIVSIIGRGDDSFATEIGGQKLATLEDGSRVTLNTDTKLTVAFTKGERRVLLRRGEALFEVAHDAGRPFMVEAGGQRVTALGTTFVVREDGGVIAVTLIEGKVRVAPTGAGEGGHVLAPGERLTFDGAGAHLDRPSIEGVTAWRRGEVVFRDTPVAQAITEMNRYTRTPIRLTAPPGDRRVNGVFRTNADREFARLLAELYDWRYDDAGSNQMLSAGR